MTLLNARPDESKAEPSQLPRLSDRAIKRLLVADLQEDRRTRGQRVRVDVKQGVVVVGGTVATDEVRRVVERAAWRLSGVEQVCNLLRVSARGAA